MMFRGFVKTSHVNHSMLKHRTFALSLWSNPWHLSWNRICLNQVKPEQKIYQWPDSVSVYLRFHACSPRPLGYVAAHSFTKMSPDGSVSKSISDSKCSVDDLEVGVWTHWVDVKVHSICVRSISLNYMSTISVHCYQMLLWVKSEQKQWTWKALSNVTHLAPVRARLLLYRTST